MHTRTHTDTHTQACTSIGSLSPLVLLRKHSDFRLTVSLHPPLLAIAPLPFCFLRRYAGTHLLPRLHPARHKVGKERHIKDQRHKRAFRALPLCVPLGRFHGTAEGDGIAPSLSLGRACFYTRREGERDERKPPSVLSSSGNARACLFLSPAFLPASLSSPPIPRAAPITPGLGALQRTALASGRLLFRLLCSSARAQARSRKDLSTPPTSCCPSPPPATLCHLSLSSSARLSLTSPPSPSHPIPRPEPP